MTKKQGFTRDKHVETGRMLYRMREDLVHLLTELGHAYPVTGKICKTANGALGRLDDLRCVLDDAVHRENPSKTDQALVYYPYPDQQGMVSKAMLKALEEAQSGGER